MTMQPYLYGNANPVLYFDPLGLWGWRSVTKIVASVAVVAVVTTVVVASGGTAAAVLVPAAIGFTGSASVSAGVQYATTGSVSLEDTLVNGSLGAAGAATASLIGPALAASTQSQAVYGGLRSVGMSQSMATASVGGAAEGGAAALTASFLGQAADGEVDPGQLAVDASIGVGVGGFLSGAGAGATPRPPNLVTGANRRTINAQAIAQHERYVTNWQTNFPTATGLGVDFGYGVWLNRPTEQTRTKASGSGRNVAI